MGMVILQVEPAPYCRTDFGKGAVNGDWIFSGEAGISLPFRSKKKMAAFEGDHPYQVYGFSYFM